MIRLENVSKVFTSSDLKVDAVQQVSLRIEPGEIYGIIGFSGAGKSTLVRLMNLLERPTEGEVFIGGTNITKLSAKALRQMRKKIGMIFQQFNLSESRTVYENVAYPLRYGKLSKQEIDTKVHQLLELVDLTDKIKAYPSQLSGGQKQRVALARALANEPQILLCDEATSALDPQTTLAILKLLKKLNRELGITIVVITHEMQVVKEICTRVAVMEGGRVVEQGDVFQIFAAPQQPITQSFIDTTTNISKINNLIEEDASITHLNPGECMVKLKYHQRNVAQALVSVISREYGVDVNIVFGNIEVIGTDPLGALIAILSGKRINEAIAYMQQQNVGVEVILDARISA